MSKIIRTLTENSRSRVKTSKITEFRSPNYDCTEQEDGLKLVVYVPGVESSDIEITARRPDLMITARKRRFVRVNFSSLHLESAQRDYRLMLRLGNGLDYENLRAEINDGILTIVLPKRDNLLDFGRLRKVA
jgi:HSP20 family molecular chaperone IbpA